MAAKPKPMKKSGSTRHSVDAVDKDQLIIEQKNRIAVLENELRLKREEATSSNISVRKRAEEVIRRNEEPFRSYFEMPLIGIAITSLAKGWMLVNDKICAILGYSRDDLMQTTWDKLTHPDDLKIDVDHFNRLLSGEIDNYTIDKRFIRKDGSIIWTTISIGCVRKPDGTVDYTVGLMQDITERKRAEEALAAAYRQFQSIIDNTPAIVYAFDLEERFVMANTAIAELLNSTPEQMIGKRRHEFMPKEDADWHEANDRQAIEAGRALEFEEYSQLKGRSITWLTTKFPLRDAHGRIYAVAGISADISERKRAEEALRESEVSLARAQKIAHIGSWEWDITSNTNKWSEETYRIFGIKPGGFGGNYESFIEHVHPDDRAWVREAAEKAIRDKTPFSFDYRIILPDGTIRHLHNENEIVTDSCGNVVKLRGTVQDITERKQSEEELKAAKSQAELYLDLMGHDINNMHQIALGYLELAREMRPEAGESEFLDKPIEVLQRSARLIRNVRKLQKLNDGVFQTELVDVCTVLVDVQREFGTVPHKAISLNLNACECCHVRANELLHDVFINLVGNAIKHTGNRADIEIDLDVVNDSSGRYCRVTVEDNGPGIHDDFKASIFNRALKGTNKAKGMGLGLYLVKSLVDSYGGHVWVEDRVSGDHTKGARFVVMLPAVNQ